MMRFGRLEAYVLSRSFFNIGVALAVIATVVVLVQFVDLSRSVGVRADVSVGQLFGLTALRAPSLMLRAGAALRLGLRLSMRPRRVVLAGARATAFSLSTGREPSPLRGGVCSRRFF